MMLALLVGLVLLVLVLPLLPALCEWRRPRDVVPLKIDETDALDPLYLAHSFAVLLAEAVKVGATYLGGSDIAHVTRGANGVPLLVTEVAAKRTDRLWHIQGDIHLPENIGFYAEVSASAGLHMAAHNVYRALWAGGLATVAPFSTVLRWVHGRAVHVGAGCHLAGRVTAQDTLAIEPGVFFMLLHASRIDFVAQHERCRAHPPVTNLSYVAITDWPDGAVWNPQVCRAFARSALQVGDRHAWHGDIVCLADLGLGQYCKADGSLKARGSLHVGIGCHISGSVVANGSVYLAANCEVLGSVLSETAIVVGLGCTIGAPGNPATITAPYIDMAPGATVYGTVWAEEKGWTTELASRTSTVLNGLSLGIVPACGLVV